MGLPTKRDQGGVDPTLAANHAPPTQVWQADDPTWFLSSLQRRPAVPSFALVPLTNYPSAAPTAPGHAKKATLKSLRLKDLPALLPPALSKFPSPNVLLRLGSSFSITGWTLLGQFLHT